jgi:hypothetical protein
MRLVADVIAQGVEVLAGGAVRPRALVDQEAEFIAAVA